MWRRFLLLAALAAFLPVTAGAQTHDDGHCLPSSSDCIPLPNIDGPRTVDPALEMIRTVIDEEGLDSPLFGPAGAPANIDEERVSVTVRFDDELSDEERAHYKDRGLHFETREGRSVQVGTIYLARVEWAALDDLADDRRVERIESTWSPTLRLPLEETSEMVGAAQVQRHPELGVDGSGVTVVDIDDGFDVFHPHMFRADGGLYEWHDEENTGQFDPGVDTVEIDGERVSLRVLPATQISAGGTSEHDGEFRTRRDWLYADVNDNHRRDVGPADGFQESDPAYGEPLFVADDVDGDGNLDPGEKLIRLDTSKFKKLVHDGRILRAR